MRIFFDANVLFSAAITDGVIRRMVREVRERGHECWADGFVVGEARRNVLAKKPAAMGEFDRMLALIHLAGESTQVIAPALASLLPGKDQPVLAAAMACGCEMLVTGDLKHFGPLYGQTLGGVTIYSAQQLAAALLG